MINSIPIGLLSGRVCRLVQKMQFRSLGWEDPLKEEMATYSSIPDWEIPWTEEPGRESYNPWGCKESDMA